VHVAFGTPLGADYETPEEVAAAVDRQIIDNYHLHATNLFAYQTLHGAPAQLPATTSVIKDGCSAADFQQRIDAMPAAQRDYALGIYANAISSKLQLNAAGESAAMGSPTVAD
jgi:hypothetical protein